MSVGLPRGKSSVSLKDEPRKKPVKKFTAGKLARNSSYGAHLNKLTRIKSNDSGGSSLAEAERPNFSRSKSSADMLKNKNHNKSVMYLLGGERTKSMTNLKVVTSKPGKHRWLLGTREDSPKSPKSARSVNSSEEEEVDSFDAEDVRETTPLYDSHFILSQSTGQAKPIFDAPRQATENSTPTLSEQRSGSASSLRSVSQPSVAESLSSSVPAKSTVETRTQQKLWLQRENVNSLVDMADSNNAFVSNVTRLEFEQLSREFLTIRRYNNPIVGSLARVNQKSLAVKKVRDQQPQPEKFPGNLAEYGAMVEELWKKNCTDFQQDRKVNFEPQEPKRAPVPKPQPVRQYGHPPPTTRAQQQMKRSSLNIVNLQN
ncbi:hypothetical protein OGAPHI_000701 [Ogataea philodendri]|uniref:Uncharacterized protein n=1 Tax=Ogataea philodendri TaxID=1378263 RepID=A0A9P8PG91_9ASCO|nr:uncharacterized protein OGAPHI_000701 [Ogataea philodendri]KAH3670990.1 hypothetical protein OGAPHI_000701 [Ogataea philodendri]